MFQPVGSTALPVLREDARETDASRRRNVRLRRRMILSSVCYRFRSSPDQKKKILWPGSHVITPYPPSFSYPLAIRKETAGDSARNYGDGFLAQRLNPPLFLRLVLFSVHTPTKPYLTLFTFPIPFRCPQHAKILKRNPFDWTFLKKKKKNKTGKRIVLALPPGVYICQCRATTTTTTTPPHQKIFV